VKLYEIILKPQSAFGTPLKGDTLFGHFCWQAAYDSALVQGGLKHQLKTYSDRPFAIFSSAFPVIRTGNAIDHIFKRPDMPMNCLFKSGKDREETMRQAKDNKKKKWMRVSNDLTPDLSPEHFISDKELLSDLTDTGAKKDVLPPFTQTHNSINRLTQTTGTGMFAPYATENFFYAPGIELAVFILIDETAINIDQIRTGLDRIGQWGFGRDASTGLGRFTVINEPIPVSVTDGRSSNALYTLAPSVPVRSRYSRVYYKPFIRFGKHGDRLATAGNPFKNPVIMADEGAVLIPSNRSYFDKPYVGQAVTGVSRNLPETVVQGYAPCLPIKLES